MIDITPTQHLRSSVASRLTERIDELVDAVCSAVFAEVGPYQQLALPGTVKPFRADVRGSLDAYVRTVADGSPLGAEDVERLRRVGAERARQGIAADAVTDALEVGMRVCWHAIRGAVLAGGEPRVAAEALADLAGEAFGVLKVATDAVVAGHADEAGRSSYTRARARAELVARLVDGTWSDERELRRAARGFGVELDRRWVLLVLTPASQQQAADLELQVAEALAAVPRTTALVGTPRAVPTPHVPVLLPTADEALPAETVDAVADAAAERDLLVLVPRVAWVWTALPHAYRNHVDAIVCARAATRNGGAVTETECSVYRLLRSLPLSQRVEYVRSVLGPVLELPPTKSREALATLDAYF